VFENEAKMLIKRNFESPVKNKKLTKDILSDELYPILGKLPTIGNKKNKLSKQISSNHISPMKEIQIGYQTRNIDFIHFKK